MWQNILDQAANLGIFAALFVGLMIYLLQNTSKREEKYIAMIDQLQISLSVINEVQKQAKTISDTLSVMYTEISDIKQQIK